MKKFRQFFKSFFIRHIAGPDPLSAQATIQEPAADLEMMRFSVWQYLRAAKAHELFLLSYAADYATLMDELRLEGWKVDLGVTPDGALAYVISKDRSGMFA